MNDCQQKLTNYKLLHLLGRSDFSEVYFGEHIYNHAQVAIKLIHGYETVEDREKFLHQYSSIAGFNHPHIMGIKEYGIEEQTAFLVMDYAAGGSLRHQHPKGSRVSLEMVIVYVKQVAAALQYIHNQGLVHRDIKPHNMLLSVNDTVLLNDFGAVVPSCSLDASNTYDFEGTILYTSPEQLQGRPLRRSDQYALAVVIYEWLSGTWPFSGSFHEIAHQHLFVAPAPFQERGVNIPTNIEQVLVKALEKDPQKRFVSTKLFAEELDWSYKVAQARGLLPASENLIKEKQALAITRNQFKSPVSFLNQKC